MSEEASALYRSALGSLVKVSELILDIKYTAGFVCVTDPVGLKVE